MYILKGYTDQTKFTLYNEFSDNIKFTRKN